MLPMNTHTRRSVTTTALVAASTGLLAIAAPAASASTSSTSSVSAPAVVDTAPVITAPITAHPGALSVSWTPGNGTVRGYAVLATSGVGPAAVVKGSAIVPADASEATVSGLTNGSTYHVTVVPFTDAGLGLSSAVVDGTPTAESPVPAISEAVRNLAATKGLGFVTASWAAPVNDNGATIVAYSVIVIDRAGNALGGWRNVRPDVRSASLSGLKGGHTYDVYVLPVTAAGFGKVAPGVAITPSATSIVLPKAPTAPAWSTAAPVGDTAVVSWGPAFEQGEAVTGYNVIVIQHNDMTAWKVTGADQRQVTVPLDEGTPAAIYVVAQSASGFGALPEAPIPAQHG